MPSTAEHHEANRAFYDRISASYDWLADANERSARQAGLALLDLKPAESVLEVGFGTGNEILDMANLVGPQGKVAGIDISSGMLAVAQGKVDQAAPATSIDLRVADARALPFDAGTFDAAYASFTLELFPEEDLPTVLAEIRRVLKKGGRLAAVSMAEVKDGESPSFLERTYVWMHRHFPHIVDCRPIDLPTLLDAAGFQVRKVTDMKIWTMPVAAVLATAG